MNPAQIFGKVVSIEQFDIAKQFLLFDLSIAFSIEDPIENFMKKLI